MSVDSRKTSIVIKGEDKTQDVLRVASKDGRAVVTYSNGKSYPYSPQNVLVLSNSELLPTRNRLITLSGSVLSNVSGYISNVWKDFSTVWIMGK